LLRALTKATFAQCDARAISTPNVGLWCALGGRSHSLRFQ
jgi:hypothetical protein